MAASSTSLMDRLSIPKWLLYENIIASPGYNRWLFPPAALLVHFSIGQAYSYSVFNKPLTKLCHGTCTDWNLVQVGWVFTLFFIFLGSSAAIFGRFLERSGPRLSGVIAALCWGLGYVLASIAVKFHNLPLLYIGNGVIGGIGLGCGYISPVSTLLKWFPDRRGMATGLAIAGFGGGAVIGAPLGTLLLAKYGVANSFLILGIGYMCAMLLGAMCYRVPPDGWKPEGWEPPTAAEAKDNANKGYTDANEAIFTPQFWLLWVMLCSNVTAGIALLGQLSLIIQDIFKESATVAAAVVGVASLCNIGGRFFWSTLSDKTGRWAVYTTYFVLGMAGFASLPALGHGHNLSGFLAVLGIIMTMYGGGFAAIPAYISDFFGVKQAGAIHGRVLTAWSVAAVIGPYILNYIRVSEARKGTRVELAYDRTLYILTGILSIGLIANCLVPIVNKYYPVKLTVVNATVADANTTIEEGVESKCEGKPVEKVSKPASSEKGKVDHVDFSKISQSMIPVTLLWWAIPMSGFAWGLTQIAAKLAALKH